MRTFPFHSLLHWSEMHGRHTLPWRQYFHLSTKDLGYHVWLSEILLQQTQADRVIPYYQHILKHFPTVESLASVSYEEFFPFYQGLGYYSRARNMLKAAKIVAQEYGGIFPNDTEKLRKLPGVGPYTEAAIRAFVYDAPVLSFDTNLEKILSRYYHGSRFHRLSSSEKSQISKDFIQSGISGRFINAAFMDFGALISANNKPPNTLSWENLRQNYPLENCLWMEQNGISEIQEKKKKTVFPTKDASIIVVLHQNHKLYYSSKNSEYEPFILPPTEEDIRHSVQEYFRENYHLEVSVRPIHDKFFRDDQPFVVCNAQIQQWIQQFRQYHKENWVFRENP